MAPGEEIKKVYATLPEDVTLVAVSKTHPADSIMEVYRTGQRIFGESRPQEMKAKFEALPKDIIWHMIGHLQTNKIKYIAPFVSLIQSVDSVRLMAAIDKEAAKLDRVIDILLEIHVAREDSKSGWAKEELISFLRDGDHKHFSNIRIRGLMTIASLTEDEDLIRREMMEVKELFDEIKSEFFYSHFDTLSMGMTSDYNIAIQCGANMVRIGSLIFGNR